MNTHGALPRTAVLALACVIVLASAAVLFSGDWEGQRLGAILLLASYCLLGLGLGGAVLLALLYVTGARWSDVIRPVAEKLTVLVPIGGLGLLLVLVAFPSLYPWVDQPNEAGSRFQALWLCRPCFLARSVIYVSLWIGLVALLVRASRRNAPAAGISALFLVVFAITCWLSSVDWIMSLEPRWSSTVFGIYHFASMFLGALAAMVVLVVCLDFLGYFGGKLTRDHRRDLGTLLFAFSSFWMYIWFSQYLLIWYVNIPEETEYFVLRQREPWQTLLIATLVLNWAVPFLVLLFRRAKETSIILLAVAVIVLVGHWLDLYLMILPPIAGSGGTP
jgi:hypothetical protein